MSEPQQEFYAASVEEAVDKASATMGIPRDKLDYRILDWGSAGFLGIGTRDARIVVQRPESHVSASPSGLSSLQLPGDVRSPAVEDSTEQDISQPAQTGEEDLSDETSEVPHDLIVAVDDFMTSLLGLMGFDATVDAHDAGDTVEVDVVTEEIGLFIGQKGETIDAIQHLLNVVIYRQRPFLKRIVVDSEGYRQRRVEALQGMAHRTARRALREKRSLSLPPMSAAERRVVHIFLEENPDVVTTSEGQDENRRVIVNPV
jgi:spoIIIJ-associated protein